MRLIDADGLIKAFEALDLMNGQYAESFSNMAGKHQRRADREGGDRMSKKRTGYLRGFPERLVEAMEASDMNCVELGKLIQRDRKAIYMYRNGDVAPGHFTTKAEAQTWADGLCCGYYIEHI